jgi:hypothetical protein
MSSLPTQVAQGLLWFDREGRLRDRALFGLALALEGTEVQWSLIAIGPPNESARGSSTCGQDVALAR